MRKNVFFLAALATLSMATSCSQDEQQSVNQGHAISFNAALNVTRAQDFANVPDEFHVFGIREGGDPLKPFIDNTPFKKEATANSWVSPATHHYFWKDDNEKITFFAYAPSFPVGQPTINGSGIKDFTVETDAAQQVDLLFGSAMESKISTKAFKGVPIKLNHILTQVCIKATDTNPAYVCTIKSVGLGNIKKTGSYDFKYRDAKWDAVNTVEKFVVNETTTLTGKEKTPVDLLKDAKDFKLIPQDIVAWDRTRDIDDEREQAYFVLELSVKTAGGDQFYEGEAFVPVKSIKWEPGKKYTYTLDFSNGFGYKKDRKPIVDSDNPIKFVDVKISSWNEESVDIAANEKKASAKP